MPVILAEQAPTFEPDGAVVTGLAAPSRGSKDVCAWRIRLAPDHASPAHTLTREEVFVVLGGAVTAQYDDREETAFAGGALIVPAGQEFHLIARGAPAEAVCVLPVGGQATIAGTTITPPWAE